MMKQIILFLIIISSLNSCGQKEKKSQTSDSAFDSLIPPKQIGWVSDFDKVFTTAETIYLDSIINSHEIQTTNEIAVVTIQLDSSQIKTSEDFNMFSLSLFRSWGVGKKDKENGVGILISINLRKIRIEVGYGLELKLTDEEAKKIIDTIIIPEFKNGAYYAGILSGLKEIFEEIK